MKYIATRDFWSGTTSPLSDNGKNVVIKRGAIVEFGGDVLWQDLPKDEYQKYSNFFNYPPALVLFDSSEGKQLLVEIEAGKTPKERRTEEFAKLDRCEVFKWPDKDLAIWQSRHDTDEPGWRLAECEWQRRTTEQVVKATVRAARVQSWFGIAAVVIGAILGACLSSCSR
jgi:hypothetical protein